MVYYDRDHDNACPWHEQHWRHEVAPIQLLLPEGLRMRAAVIPKGNRLAHDGGIHRSRLLSDAVVFWHSPHKRQELPLLASHWSLAGR